ncbi:MAG: prolyl oligopeptidase family serine peptidase [Armatimonas sp.]
MPYRLPPPELVAALDAPPTPFVQLSPDRRYLLLTEYEAYPPVALLARPFEKLAGLRLDPTRPGTQSLTRYTGMRLLAIEDGTERPITGVPPEAEIDPPVFAPGGARFAFLRDLEGGGIQLWIGDVESASVHCPNPDMRLADAISAPLRWLDDERLLVTLAPDGWENTPRRRAVPDGPIETEAAGKKSRMATYQDLLQNTDDELLFTHLCTVQLALVDATTGIATPIGAPTLLASAQPSPDRQFLCVTRLVPPFSYRVPYHLFARTTELWDLQTGTVLSTLSTAPISDEVPQQGVPVGPRGFQWHQTRPATLLWVEALDGGDPLAKVEHRDRLVSYVPGMPPPPPSLSGFAGTGEPESILPERSSGPSVPAKPDKTGAGGAVLEPGGTELLRLTYRFAGIEWLERGDELLLNEYDRDRRWRTTHRVNFAHPALGDVIFDLSVNDAYGDPGGPVAVPQPDGRRLVRCDGEAIFLAGRGATPEGERPFLDRFDLITKEKTRLFESADDSYETFVAFIGTETSFIRSQQNRTTPTNFFIGERALTHFTDPHPHLTGMHKELVRYQRTDGVPLSGTLYLPPGYEIGSGVRLPLLFWAYPEEYNDASTAGQVRGSDKTFTRLAGTSPLWFAAQGWAVLMDAAVPVVGDPETMNDTFAEQIVEAAQAAVRYLSEERGLVDARRVVCGGHSYGAFMTANLLAHAPGLFAAGIARSGAYNRTLTPFGFQSERRSYWEAKDTYHALSPFTHVDKIKDPLLLIHGQADNNPGTHTVQSERFYQALQAFGVPSRLVLLPYESHGYRARESVLHTLWEMLTWAERHTSKTE